MRTAIATLESISPYQQGKYYQVPKEDPKETAEAYEKRTWQERCHYNEEGYIFIPPMQFKKSLENAASFLSVKIVGRGKATYTKHFRAGILVNEGLTLAVKKDDVAGQWLFLPSDGRSGGTTRVAKCFPTIDQWKGNVTYYVLDETITQDIFEQHLIEAGNFIGVGVFRPLRGGYNGRYKLVNLDWN